MKHRFFSCRTVPNIFRLVTIATGLHTNWQCMQHQLLHRTLVVRLRDANAVNKSNVDRSWSLSLGDDRMRMMIMMTIEEKVQRDSDTSASHRLFRLWLPNESMRRRLLGHPCRVDRVATARNAIKRVLIEVRQSSAFQSTITVRFMMIVRLLLVAG
jgi:hypothetical protein